jgi:preprotein translocase subunit YajC
MRYHQKGDRVMTPSGLGVLESVQEDNTCAVRLINQETNWPFPQWVYVHVSKIKFARNPKNETNPDDFEPAPF